MKNEQPQRSPAKPKPKRGRLKRWLRRIVILVAVLIAITYLITDILYVAADPRIKYN